MIADRRTHTDRHTHRHAHTRTHTHTHTDRHALSWRSNNKFPWNCRPTYTHKWPAGKENDVKYSQDYLFRPYNRTLLCARCIVRGVVVRERGGTPFRQIFWSRNGAPANIVGHRWNANSEAFRQIAPKRGIWHQKFLKKFPRMTPLGSPQREGATPSRRTAPTPARLHAVRRGASSPVAGT